MLACVHRTDQGLYCAVEEFQIGRPRGLPAKPTTLLCWTHSGTSSVTYTVHNPADGAAEWASKWM